MKHTKFIALLLSVVLMLTMFPLSMADTLISKAVMLSEEYEEELWEIIVEQGKCGDDVEWRLHGDGWLEIIGTGEMYDYEKNKAPWLEFADSIRYADIEYDVTSLCSYAFLDCRNMTSMYISYNSYITEIKEGTFSGCSSLENMTLTRKITSVEKNAFYGCKNLEYIEIENPKTEIYDSENTIHKSAVIHGYEGTSSQEYAKKYNREFVSMGSSVELPAEADMLNLNEFVSVKASEKSPKWYKFRACGPVAWIGCVTDKSEETGEVGDIIVYDDAGFEVPTDGFGGGSDDEGNFVPGPFYNLTRGDYYYIKVICDCRIGTHIPYSWMPEWTSENKEFDADMELISLNVEKTFRGDENTCWNVYSEKGEGKINFGDEYGYYVFGTMSRLASPVNIHTETVYAESNFEILGCAHYKYDPNNEKECEMIGASTTQLTMKAELLPGEKEYRFDNVYCLIEQKGLFTFKEERHIYVPVGYYIDGSHVVKHAKKDHIDENYDGMCDMCGVVYREITEIKITNTDTVKSDNKSDNIFVLNGTAVAKLLETANVAVSVVDKNGKAVKSDKKLVTGMQLILKNKNGKIIDTKTVVVPGDVDCDGNVKSADARLALRAAVKLETLDNYQSAAADMADMSKKLSVTSADARYILRVAVGLESIGDWLKAFN